MIVNKLSKTFIDERCAKVCKANIDRLHKYQSIKPIIKEIYTDDKTVHIEFLPETGAGDSDYLNAYMDGFQDGYIFHNMTV